MRKHERDERFERAFQRCQADLGRLLDVDSQLRRLQENQGSTSLLGSLRRRIPVWRLKRQYARIDENVASDAAAAGLAEAASGAGEIALSLAAQDIRDRVLRRDCQLHNMRVIDNGRLVFEVDRDAVSETVMRSMGLQRAGDAVGFSVDLKTGAMGATGHLRWSVVGPRFPERVGIIAISRQGIEEGERLGSPVRGSEAPGLIDLRSDAERRMEQEARTSLGVEDEQIAHELVDLIQRYDALYSGNRSDADSVQSEIKAIGHRLCGNGGDARMKRVAYRVAALGAGKRVRVRDLELHWDGICGWIY